MLAGSIQIAGGAGTGVPVLYDRLVDGRLQVVSDPYQLHEDLISRLM